MATAKREQDTPLTERLFEEFYRFSFFRAVGLLELLAPGKTQIGNTLNPADEPARFSVKPGFVFPPSDISNLRQADERSPAEMEVAFMGLVGPSGVLPNWFNELVVERMQQKDFALSSFLDIFHHRLISLFYLAWKKYRFPVTYLPEVKDRFSHYLICLIGLGTENLPRITRLPEESLAFYSGLLSRQVPSAIAIEATVEYCSGVNAEVHQFIDRLIPLDPDDYTQIGIANGEIGVNAVCGSETWENQTKFRINLGPMNYPRFVRFLPTGDLLRPIFSLVRYMVGIDYDFDIRLVLKREEAFPCQLGGQETPASPHLGWSTWLKSSGTTLEEDPFITLQEAEAGARFAIN
jgi:type VI secretion system protein ImpH